jgi:hypothetical protein
MYKGGPKTGRHTVTFSDLLCLRMGGKLKFTLWLI